MEIYICICVCISHCAAANTRPFKCMLITADPSVNEKHISIVWGWSQPSVPGLLQQRRGRGCCGFRLAKRRDWHRMDECSLGQSAVAGYQSGLINGALRRKQMPPPLRPHQPPPSPLLYGWFRWSSRRTSASRGRGCLASHQSAPVGHLF